MEITDFSYLSAGRRVEAVLTKPVSNRPLPGIVMLPGTQRTAWDVVPHTRELAQHGFVVLAITQPGFGGSEGAWDFVGSGTILAVNEGIDRFQTQSFVNPERLALFGISTGAMLAALIATQRDDLRAAVLASGVYDARAWFRSWCASAPQDDLTVTLKALRAEDLSLAEALALRSSIHRVADLDCPVLIWHGEKDKIAPIEQAHRLCDALAQLGKPFETVFSPKARHGHVPLRDVLPFLKRYL